MFCCTVTIYVIFDRSSKFSSSDLLSTKRLLKLIVALAAGTVVAVIALIIIVLPDKDKTLLELCVPNKKSGPRLVSYIYPACWASVIVASYTVSWMPLKQNHSNHKNDMTDFAESIPVGVKISEKR